MSKCEQCIIRQFKSLKALNKEELVRISDCKTSLDIKKGDVIFSEGESLNGVFCIKNGVCKLSKLSAKGKDQIVKLVIKGDIMGQRSLVSEERTNLSAIALNDMKVCFIPKAEIIKNLNSNSTFSMEVLKDLAHDLKEADDLILNMTQKSVKQRLAEVLMYLKEHFGEDSEGFLNITLSREDIANIVGTVTESAIRVLSQFKKEGMISTSGKRIKIEDFGALGKVV